MTIEKFEANHVVVNVNKLKPYTYMEFEVQKQKQQMLIYWEQNAGAVQAKNYHMEQYDENYEIQKPQINNVVNEKHIKDPALNRILIFDL